MHSKGVVALSEILLLPPRWVELMGATGISAIGDGLIMMSVGWKEAKEIMHICKRIR